MGSGAGVTKRGICAVALCLMFLHVSPAYGQDSEKKTAGDWFNKGYVTDAFEGKGSEAKKPLYVKTTPSPGGEGGEGTDAVKSSAGGDFSEVGDEPTPAPSADVEADNIFAEGAGVPVKSISLIMDGTKEATFPDLVRTYLRLVQGRKIKPGSLYLLGHYTHVVPLLEKHANSLIAGKRPMPTIEELENRQPPTPLPGDQVNIDQLIKENPGAVKALTLFSSVRFASEIPRDYPVKLVPTWILNTEPGDVVLEGLKDPSRYINQKGEFVMNDLLNAEKSETKPSAEPTLKQQ